MKSVPTSQKLRGGYYTPARIAEFLAEWAIRSATDHLLEPGCGDGAITTAIGKRVRDLGHPGAGRLVAVELDPIEAATARRRLAECDLPASYSTFEEGDFFQRCRDWLALPDLFRPASGATRFDAVIGNPPFIRFQSFPESQRTIAFDLMRPLGLRPNGLTNAWVPFLVASARLLHQGGRLAMVIPAELMQVGYAAEVRRFLSEYFERITIVSFRGLVFEAIQQEVVLLLAEREVASRRGIRMVELATTEDLDDVRVDDSSEKPKDIDHSTEKWTQYYLAPAEIDLLRNLRSHQEVRRFGEFASIDVGLVTGENDFFVLSTEQVADHGLAGLVTPIVSRSAHLEGIQFRSADWRTLHDQGQGVWLFAPPGVKPSELSIPARRYVKYGESQRFHEGYKCRIRKRWYVVPSQWTPDAFALRQVHGFPKVVLNAAGATTTDTIHRVRFHDRRIGKAIAGAFVNSLTLAFSEVMGRGYGGGVQTFEPSEFEGLLIPNPTIEVMDASAVDRHLRGGRVQECLDHTDAILLRRVLGLDRDDALRLRRIWETLRDRRVLRRTIRRTENGSSRKIRRLAATL